MLFFLLLGLLVLMCSNRSNVHDSGDMVIPSRLIDKWFVLVAQWLAIIVREALVLSPLKRARPMAVVSSGV